LNGAIDSDAALLDGLQVEPHRREHVIPDLEYGDASHEVASTVEPRTAHFPFDPDRVAAACGIDDLRFDIGNAGKDLSPILPDLVAATK